MTPPWEHRWIKWRRVLRCGGCGKLIQLYRTGVRMLFGNYSWDCPNCGVRFCSECEYQESRGIVTAVKCGRF